MDTFKDIWDGVHGWAGWTSETWAAWVQAVGSVAAIFVAVVVARCDRRNARKDLAETRIDTLLATLKLYESVSKSLLHIAGGLGKFTPQEACVYSGGCKASMRVLMEMMQRVSFQDIPVIYFAVPGMNILNAYGMALSHVDRMAARAGAQVFSIDDVTYHGSDLRSAVQGCADNLVHNVNLMHVIAAKYDGFRVENLSKLLSDHLSVPAPAVISRGVSATS